MKILIVKTVINTLIALGMWYGALKLVMWLFPQQMWFNVLVLGVLAVDFALMVSGIAPEGLFSMLRRRR